MMQFCTFQINDSLYGIEIKSVKEIKDEFKITSIHHAPKDIKGFVNIRGQVYLVIEINDLLNEDKYNKIKKHLILFKQRPKEDLFGILVDRHRGVYNIDEKKIEYFNNKKYSSNYNKKDIIIGICKLENQLMTIINPQIILPLISF